MRLCICVCARTREIKLTILMLMPFLYYTSRHIPESIAINCVSIQIWEGGSEEREIANAVGKY